MKLSVYLPSSGLAFYCYLSSSQIMRRRFDGEPVPRFVLSIAASNLIGYGA